MASFEELKAKYKSVIDTVQSKQVQMANLHMQDGKLFMKGTAPSQQAANAVWDEIKRINPKLDDIIADFPIDTKMQSGMQGGMQGGQQGNQQRGQQGNQKGASQSGTPRMYKVKPGDTLSKISQQFFGDPNQYQKIFEANRDKLSDPNKIQPGQELKIPA
jgi:nucleoid-associated protein YgaU